MKQKYIGIRITEDLDALLEARAGKNLRSKSSELLSILKKALGVE